MTAIPLSRPDELAEYLKQQGSPTGVHCRVPCHRQPVVPPLMPPPLLRTETVAAEVLSLPLSAGRSDAEIDEVAGAGRAFFAG